MIDRFGLSSWRTAHPVLNSRDGLIEKELIELINSQKIFY